MPPKKPVFEKIKTVEEEVQSKTERKITKINGEIIPKSKPLVVKKQKSKIYSNKAQRKLLDFRVKSVKNSINHFLDEI